MNPLKSISIRARMVLTLGLILALFAGFAVFSVSRIRKLGEVTSDIYEHPLRVSNASLRAQTGIVRMHREMKDLVLARTGAEQREAIRTLRAEEQEVYHDLGIIRRWILGEEGKMLIEETMDLFEGWEPIRTEVLRLVEKGDKTEAGRVTREEGAKYVARLDRQISEVNQYALRKADLFLQRAVVLQSQLLRNTILVITGVTLLCIVIGYAMIVSILPDILTLRDTMAAIVTTGTLAKARIRGKNEITEMARHFNALIDKLGDQLWIRDGQAGLSKVLILPADYDELADRVVGYVSRYVGAASGAMYECESIQKVCVLRASYALVAGEHFSQRYSFHEGVVGQVAADGEPILLPDASRQPAPEETKLLSSIPLHIYAAPLVYENVLYGVIEIAMIEPPAASKIEFIDTAAKSISTALCAAAQKQRIEELLAATRESKNELERQSAALQQRTAELHQTSEQLQQRNAELEVRGRELEEANRLKAEFMSNISHELRTPLNSVMALSRVLKKNAAERKSSEESEYLDIIEHNGRQLLGLIDDILDLAKIESGRVDLKPGPLSLSSSIDAIADGLEPLAEEKGVQLQKEIPDDLPELVTDEKSLHHILRNLLGNAVKFTEQGAVTVTAKHTEDTIVVDVTDTGIGIAEADLPHVFEKFWQADATLSSKHDGTGLGLTIAFETAKMLGGRLTAASRPGEGSTFTLELPIRRNETQPPWGTTAGTTAGIPAGVAIE